MRECGVGIQSSTSSSTARTDGRADSVAFRVEWRSWPRGGGEFELDVMERRLTETHPAADVAYRADADDRDRKG